MLIGQYIISNTILFILQNLIQNMEEHCILFLFKPTFDMLPIKSKGMQ